MVIWVSGGFEDCKAQHGWGSDSDCASGTNTIY